MSEAGQILSRTAVLERLACDSNFRSWWGRALCDWAPPSFVFETPAWTLHNLSETFEFVGMANPALERAQVDAVSFAPHFSAAPAGTLALEFANLGGDAQLVVPTPGEVLEHHAHLAVFLRHAESDRQHALWQQLARTISAQLDDRPLWVSTAGLGVIWLHWRIGVRPKYYRYRPYAQARGERSGRT